MIVPIIILSLLGIIFFGISIMMWVSDCKKEKQCTQRVAGKVIRNNARKETSVNDDKTSIYYYPVVEYYINGQYIHKEIPIGKTGKPKYLEGTSVTLMVHPEREDYCYIEGNHDYRNIYYVFLAIGIFLLVVATVLIFVSY